MRARVSIALACAALAVTRPGAAQDPKAEARKAYDEGERLTRERRYAEAAASFARADDLLPNDTALEAALEAALLGENPALAMNLLERTRRAPSAQDLPAARKVRDAFSSRAALVEVPCVEEGPACAAAIDDVPVERRRTWVAPGQHRVALRGSGGQQVDTISVAGGATHTALLRPADAPAPPPPVAGSATFESPPPTADGGGISAWWFVAGCGVTAILGGVTVGHAVAASSNKGEFDDGIEAGIPRGELEQLAADGSSLETRTNVFLVATLVAAGATAGLAVFAVDWGGEGDGQALVLPAADGARVVAIGRF